MMPPVTHPCSPAHVMPEARELRSVIEAAEQAAAHGDLVGAELNLREAAALQETELGAFHPDLASTLNNLGVIYERVDSPAEAELCYRRAYTIATTALAPDHPFVATTRKNLEDFCKARGRSFERVPVSRDRVPTRKPVERSFRPMVLGAVGALVLAMVVVAAIRFRPSDADAVSVTTPQPSTLSHELPSQPLVVAEPNPAPRTSPAAAPAATTRSVPPRESRPAVTSPATVAVMEARLCRRLSTSNWRCDPAESPMAPGLLFLYTRVDAATTTTIEHRWYREDRLRQSVELRIRPSPGSGYRTYSRRTVTAENAGNWRVEVRTADGSLLHEEQFIVR